MFYRRHCCNSTIIVKMITLKCTDGKVDWKKQRAAGKRWSHAKNDSKRKLLFLVFEIQTLQIATDNIRSIFRAIYVEFAALQYENCPHPYRTDVSTVLPVFFAIFRQFFVALNKTAVKKSKYSPYSRARSFCAPDIKFILSRDINITLFYSLMIGVMTGMKCIFFEITLFTLKQSKSLFSQYPS